MVDIFKSKTVWDANKAIVFKKFGRGLLYTVGLTAVSFIIEAFTTGASVPSEWMVYSGIIIACMQAIKKSLEKYDPAKDR